MTVYVKIKELINNTDKLSVSRLEKELGFGSGTIRRWQHNDPGLEKVIKVAEYFNVSITDLIPEEKQTGNKLLTYELENRLSDIPPKDQADLIAETLEFLDYKLTQINKKTTED